jgi:hypothetical protein
MNCYLSIVIGVYSFAKSTVEVKKFQSIIETYLSARKTDTEITCFCFMSTGYEISLALASCTLHVHDSGSLFSL